MSVPPPYAELDRLYEAEIDGIPVRVDEGCEAVWISFFEEGRWDAYRLPLEKLINHYLRIHRARLADDVRAERDVQGSAEPEVADAARA